MKEIFRLPANKTGTTSLALVLLILIAIPLTFFIAYRNPEIRRNIACTFFWTTLLDATSQIELLGNPSAACYPNHRMARNVWDMQVFNGRLYLAHGDSSLNTGPTPIWYYDFSTGRFVNDGLVDDEAITHFRIINGVLVAPGDDAKEDWTFSNYYTRDATGWTKHRTLPNGVHTNDLYGYGGYLFASYSNTDHTPILISNDNGATWFQQWGSFWSSYNYFELVGRLYVQTFPDTAQPPPHANFYQFNNTTALFEPVQGDMFPDSGVSFVPLVKSPTVTLNGSLVYLGSYSGNLDTFGLWAASDFGVARRVNLPNQAKPRDITLVSEGGVDTVYVLTSTKKRVTDKSVSYLTEVYSSTDLHQWDRRVEFSRSTFARSFEYYQGYFYFGLGGYGAGGNPSIYMDGGGWNETDVHPTVGNILRVRAVSPSPIAYPPFLLLYSAEVQRLLGVKPRGKDKSIRGKTRPEAPYPPIL
jgi:hypothetical protein